MRRPCSGRVLYPVATPKKLIVAHEVDANASLIIAAQPTRGLDVGATAFVWRSLREARGAGLRGSLSRRISTNSFDISDRLIVILSGKIVAEYRPPYRLGDAGAAMTGAH